MDNKIVSISKNKVIENEEIYKENFSFLNKVVNYEMNTLTLIEEVYDGKTRDSEISDLIRKEKSHVIWPIFSTVLTMFLFTTMFFMKNLYFIFPTIIVAGLSLFLFARYFNENNSKINVILKVYQDILKKEHINQSEMISLQKLISQEEMLDIIREHEMRVPMRTVLSALRVHFLAFNDYKAMKNYNYLMNVDKENKKYGHRSGPVVLN